LKRALLIIFLILLLDQIVKILVKTNLHMGESLSIFGSWANIQFTENEGMAFGMKLGGNFGKLILSLFRIIAVIIIGTWLYRISKDKSTNKGLIVSVALILAGAMGNIIDSAFYGLIFDESTMMQVATLFPVDGGYAGFLHGKVVDMFYFPIIRTHYPSWFPFYGGEEFIFFRPIFNVADSAITIGVFLLILFQKRFFRKSETPVPVKPAE
jgi:signal peptidase II